MRRVSKVGRKHPHIERGGKVALSALVILLVLLALMYYLGSPGPA
jgi:hypothetical protein